MRRLVLGIGALMIAAFISGCGDGSNSNSNSNSNDSGGDNTPSGGIWSYYYYADPSELNRVVVMDPASMTMVGEIPDAGLSPHSADRAGFTDRMYVRTSGSYSFDVISASSRTLLKTVPLPHKPRAAGAYNQYRNLQLISGADQPKVSIINVANDAVVGTVGPDIQPGQTISGNCGGNATGHSTWLDKDHFTLLDRYNDTIWVYKVVQNSNGYGFELTQGLKMPTGVHTINVDVPDKSLTRTLFYAEIEGSQSKGVSPMIMELTYDGNGHLAPGRTVTFPNVGPNDSVHHYGITPDGTQIWQPVCTNKTLYVVDTASMQVIQPFPIGLGGGHVNFSQQLGLAIVTNHFDQDVTIIDRATGQVTPVHINDDPEQAGLFIQSHLNWVSPDGKFFYIFATHDGVFVEIDLVNKTVSRTFYTGGTPEQSTS